jgi:sigma-B regulation protein RsbQ
VERNNVRLEGRVGGAPMLFAHGFGCDQTMWRHVWPAFADEYRIVLFDHVGFGGSDLGAYQYAKYDSLQGYADDVLELCRELELRDVVFVGHSVSSMIGVLAAAADPDRFEKLILVGPSPRYIDDPEGEYVGGFTREDIEGLLDSLDSNFLGWSATYAPAIMGADQPEELQQELTNSFCRTDPEIARHFARVTFLSDNRGDLRGVATPSLVLQCSDDIIAPLAVGEYVHRHTPGSALRIMQATGHCPHMSAPEETIALMREYLRGGRE